MAIKELYKVLKDHRNPFMQELVKHYSSTTIRVNLEIWSAWQRFDLNNYKNAVQRMSCASL